MKIKYKVKEERNGIVIGSQLLHGSDIWERKATGWYCLTTTSQCSTEPHPSTEIIDSNFKNGQYKIIK